VRAAILVTGDEILRGRIQEQDAGILARSLDDRGLRVERVVMVGDDLDAIAGAVGAALAEGMDLVCVSGGLGPTHDDLTMEAVARATGRGLALDAGALALVRARRAALSVDPAVARLVEEKQATLPEGALVLPPPGTAPGCLLEHGGAVVVVLPGPPWELRTMWEEALGREPLAGALARASRPRERVLRIHATPESAVVGALRGVDPQALARVRMGICAREGELEVTARWSAGDEWAADALEAAIAATAGDALYSRDGTTVDEMVARGLMSAGQTVAMAESCTGGLLGARLTARPGSSAYVLGGVVSYADSVKTGVLGVPEEILRAHGAVSAECAEAMAAGARRLTGADWALSITGVAGPGGGTDEKPVGLVCVGLAGPDGVRSVRQRRGGDREEIRARSVATALHLLRRALAGAPAV
jgi:nicotinamide-nucleotide amidase